MSGETTTTMKWKGGKAPKFSLSVHFSGSILRGAEVRVFVSDHTDKYSLAATHGPTPASALARAFLMMLEKIEDYQEKEPQNP